MALFPPLQDASIIIVIIVVFPAVVNKLFEIYQGLRMNGMDNVSKKSIVVGAAAAFSGEADFRRMIF